MCTLRMECDFEKCLPVQKEGKHVEKELLCIKGHHRYHGDKKICGHLKTRRAMKNSDA